MWDRQSRSYDRRFATVLGGRNSESWGLDRIPESELGLLDPVRGRDVLELGCGAARWSSSLALRGARSIGLDVSTGQLARARSVLNASGAPVGLVQGSAEMVPFRSSSFDLVFCDWGAMTFCDPFRTVPECARLLRPGGSLVFASSSPIGQVTRNTRNYRVGRRLLHDYFSLHRLDFPREVNFTLPYGRWVELFAAHGLAVERLVEPRMGRGRRSRYLSASEARWGAAWPLEAIWKLRRVGPGPRRRGARGRNPARSPPRGPRPNLSAQSA